MNRRRLALVAAALGLNAWLAPGLGAYEDLDPRSASDRIAMELGRRGILAGADDGRFLGSSRLTRYEVAGALVKLLGGEEAPSQVVVWADIPSGHPDMPAVSRVTSLQLMSGRGTRFEGLSPVTREELVRSLVRLLEVRSSAPPPRLGAPVTCPDVPLASPFGKILDRALNFWQIVPPPTGLFRAKDSLTRLEAAVWMGRTLALIDPDWAPVFQEALRPPASPPPVASPSASPIPEVPPPSPSGSARPTARPTPPSSTSSTSSPTPRPAQTIAPTPRPAATRAPLWSTVGSPSPEPSPTVPPQPRSTPEPASPAPGGTPSPGPGPLVPPGTTDGISSSPWQVALGIQSVLHYFEGLPGDRSLVGTEDTNDLVVSVPGLANLTLSAEHVMAPWVLAGRVGTILPFDVKASSSGTTSGQVSMADVRLRLDGRYRLAETGLRPEAGLALVSRITTPLSGTGNGYQTAGRTLVGLGPSGKITWLPGLAGLQIRLDAALPVMLQSHTLGNRSLQAMRWGLDLQGGLETTPWQVGPMKLGGALEGNVWASTMFDGTGGQIVFAMLASARGGW